MIRLLKRTELHFISSLMLPEPDVLVVLTELVSTMISNKRLDFGFTCLLLAAAAVSGNSQVMESVSHYSCCNAELHFNRTCEVTFSANGTNFAFFKGDTRSCTYPCRKLQDGVMRLEECAAVVGVLVCTDEMNVVEEGIQYQSQPCAMSQAPGHQGFVRLLLMTSMTGALIVKKLVC